MLTPYDSNRVFNYNEQKSFDLPTSLNQIAASFPPLYPINNQEYFYNNQSIWPSANNWNELKLNDTRNNDLQCEQYDQQSSLSVSPTQPRSGRTIKRARTTFTARQLAALEREYGVNKYVIKIQRVKLAQSLDLSENKIKVWFQNRRMKDKKKGMRKQNASDSPASSSSASSSDTISSVNKSEGRSHQNTLYGQFMNGFTKSTTSYPSWYSNNSNFENKGDNLPHSMRYFDSPTYIDDNYYKNYTPNGPFDKIVPNTPYSDIFSMSKPIKEQDVTAENMLSFLTDLNSSLNFL